jgi:hypothetical protein
MIAEEAMDLSADEAGADAVDVDADEDDEPTCRSRRIGPIGHQHGPDSGHSTRGPALLSPPRLLSRLRRWRLRSRGGGCLGCRSNLGLLLCRSGCGATLGTPLNLLRHSLIYLSAYPYQYLQASPRRRRRLATSSTLFLIYQEVRAILRSASLTTGNSEVLTKRIQFGCDEVVKAKDNTGSATLSMTYAGAEFAIEVTKALAGEKRLVAPSYMQTRREAP